MALNEAVIQLYMAFGFGCQHNVPPEDKNSFYVKDDVYYT